MTDPDEPELESRRQADRRHRKQAGERSAEMARALMELSATALASLKLDDEVREATERGRAIRSKNARRREERRLAGVLRNANLDDIEAQMEAHLKSTGSRAAVFRRAEAWRVRLVADGQSALNVLQAECAGLDRKRLTQLIENAQRQTERGWPKGATKLLFRELIRLLQA